LSKSTDWAKYEKLLDVLVEGDWAQVGSLVYHTALPGTGNGSGSGSDSVEVQVQVEVEVEIVVEVQV
jgi:hypothetical protein